MEVSGGKEEWVRSQCGFAPFVVAGLSRRWQKQLRAGPSAYFERECEGFLSVERVRHGTVIVDG